MCHVTSQENFWVTDHGKVVSIKCHNEQTFSAIFILRDEKHCQNRSRFGTRRLRPKKKICVFPVTRPTLIFPSDPKVLFQKNELLSNATYPICDHFLLVLPLSLSYMKLYCCLYTCFD